MTTRKTLPVPTATDGVPVPADRQHLEKTREIPASERVDMGKDEQDLSAEAAPNRTVDDEATVPVHSSIESSLNYEILRRQSTQDDSEDDPKKA